MLRTFLISWITAGLTAAGATFSTGTEIPPASKLIQVDLLAGWQASPEEHIAAIRFRIRPGWHTYWRAPGAAGIPPSFDWSGSSNLRAIDILWPKPESLTLGGLQSLVYTGQAILPLRVSPEHIGRDVRLRATINLGVCAQVCVPVTLSLKGRLSTASDRRVPMITAALKSVPISAAAAGLRSAICRTQPRSDGLHLSVALTLPGIVGGTEIVSIEAANPDIWVGDITSRRKGGVLEASANLYPPDGQPFALDRSGLRITVIGKRRAVDIKGCTGG